MRTVRSCASWMLYVCFCEECKKVIEIDARTLDREICNVNEKERETVNLEKRGKFTHIFLSIFRVFMFFTFEFVR